jgi:UPF0042 nucleotide-binding protein
VDNLPPRMIGSLGELFRHDGSTVKHAAVVTDVRGGDYFDELQAVLEELNRGGLEFKVVFLEANEDTLLDRFKETRRRHPFGPERSDRRKAPDLNRAPWTEAISAPGVDPPDLWVQERPSARCRSHVRRSVLAKSALSRGSRPLTGLDQAVVQHVEAGDLSTEFYRRVLGLLDFLLPAYVAEGKTHLTIGIGCTGGRHRSITVASRIARHLADRNEVSARVVHRDTRFGEGFTSGSGRSRQDNPEIR